MRHGLHYILLCASMAATLTSCDRDSFKSLIGGQKKQYIKVNVLSSDYIGTRSEQETAKEPVLTGVYGDDDFSISEYVCDIEDVMGAPGTRGTIITATGINSNGQSFTVDGWGMISPARGEPQELTNHLPKLTATYTSSGTEHWPWAGGANPKWVNESNLHIWSYYPAGKINPTITIDDTTPANNTAKFSYTTDNTDLLIAYNNEYREFKKDAAGNHTYNAAGEIVDEMVDGQSESFDVRFYHALAAIEFELNTETEGADVHSITLCKVGTDGKIITTEGIAMTGDCTVTGPSLASPTVGTPGTGTAGVSWGNLSSIKPFHYEFGTGQSVAGGYTSETGNGVFFMIPQDVEDIVVIVEFSKHGSSEYYTKVGKLVSTGEKSMDVSWKAGKYYRYKLSVGEFHLPGEPLVGAASLSATSIKFTHGGTTYSSFVKIKGVKTVGLILSKYEVKGNSAEDFYLYPVFDNNTPSADSYNPPTPSSFTYDFIPVELPAGGANMTTIYGFGGGGEETYSTAYYFDLSPTRTETGPFYYVFKIDEGASNFNIAFATNSTNNSGYFKGTVLGIVVLEVKEDTSVPSNFATIDWDNI